MEESENQELVKQLTKEQERELEQKLIELYGQLGWEHCVTFAKEAFPTKFPSDFELH